MGTTITCTRPDGGTIDAYLAQGPAGAPGVVVIQEWWGLNDQIRGVADRMARAGFTALVPDLYRGKSAVEAEEAHHLMDGLNFGEAAQQDIRGAVQHLKQTCPKVGVTGFCMGGALTVLSSTMVPEADAAVVWYGYPPIEFVDASKVRIPVIAHWAMQDAAFSMAGVEALEAKFQAAGVRYTGHRYLAYHAFANETAQGSNRLGMTQYDAAWAQVAWDRTFAFFGATLG